MKNKYVYKVTLKTKSWGYTGIWFGHESFRINKKTYPNDKEFGDFQSCVYLREAKKYCNILRQYGNPGYYVFKCEHGEVVREFTKEIEHNNTKQKINSVSVKWLKPIKRY